MAQGEVVRTGFLLGERVPRPKKAPDGFVWPSSRSADDATKKKFRAKICELLRERGMNHRDLAVLAHGEVKMKNGMVVPRYPSAARAWVMGKGFPSAENAEGLAGYFKISVDELLKPEGELVPMEMLRKGIKPGQKMNGNGHANGNGHDHEAAAGMARKETGKVRVVAEPSPPLPLPEGVAPPVVELKSFPNDPRFMHVSVSGVMPVDRALALVAMIHPEHR